MKKLIFSTLIGLMGTFATTAQVGNSFGVKGGLNYNANGDFFESIESSAKHPDRNLGYHIGVFGKLGNRFFFRPELVYTSTKSDYDNDVFKIKKIDAPMLVGLKVIGPLNVFAGPAFQYILDTDFDGINIKDIENDFSVGLNFGVGVTLKSIGIDLRYERGLSKNEARFLYNNNIDLNSRIDTRPDQLILSLSVAL